MTQDLQQVLGRLSPTKRAALEAMLQARDAKSANGVASPSLIQACSPADAGTLSYAEQRLWFLDRLEPEHPFYNMPLAARVRGPFDEQAFAESLRRLAERHQTLRFSYRLVDGVPQRTLHDTVDLSPRVVRLAGVSGHELHQRLTEEAKRPFCLSEAPLLRCVVYELAPEHRVILLVMHHIVSDGWSMWVMLNELATHYAACKQGSDSPLPPLPVQYPDYAVWQRQQLSDDRVETLADYWRTALADTPPTLELPTDNPRGVEQDYEGATFDFRLSEAISQKLLPFAEQHQATPFMVLVAAYAAWLARHTGQDDLCIGTVVANRNQSGLEQLIGFFVNTLAIRIDTEDDPSFEELVAQVRTSTLEAFDHQELPFDKLIEAVAPERDRSHAALFQTALVVQNPPRDFGQTDGLSIKPMLVDNGTAKYDLTFFFWQNDTNSAEQAEWLGQVEYRTTLFERATVDRFVETLQLLLSDALTQPQEPISKLRLLTEAERQQTIEWNATQTPVREPQLMHGRIVESLQAAGDKVVLRHAGASVTAAELLAKAETYAAELQRRGITSGDAVVVCLPRGLEAPAVMLAIWQAGAVYVPVDPDQAEQRLVFVTNDTGVSLVVGENQNFAPWLSDTAATLVTPEELAKASSPLTPVESTPHDRAYVIYTSGSTGQPKGVEVEHHSIVSFVDAQTAKMGLTAEDRIQHAMSPAFDGGLSEVLIALANGATLIAVDRNEVLDPKQLTKRLNNERVTVAKFAPALLATLEPSALPHLRAVASAGEALTSELANQWRSGKLFFNGYGPTETTVGVAMYEVTEHLEQAPPLGPPMQNVRAYVLDRHQQPVPVGVAGEIYVGGKGVARGYLNRAEETQQRFLPDSFADELAGKQSRMYRTGDLGRWRSDGVLEFLGRVDDQVQLRGYRVEPGEVAAALERLDQVKQAFVTVRPDSSGDDQLVAYVVPTDEAKTGVTTSSTTSSINTGTTDAEGEHLATWQNLMDQTHRAAGALRDVEFDVTGWMSTYTGQPIPKEEMADWARSTAQRIKDLKPRNVLEIGCGTGLILQQVAPQCESYTGTDFLGRSLRQLERVVASQPEISDRVELYEQAAHELGPLAGRKFDLIVMNSVVQYFPSLEYLARVLKQAATLLTPGGRMFLGDLRNLRLHETFASAVELHRAEQGLRHRELLGRIEARLRREEELLLDPAMFDVLRELLPELSGVQMDLKSGAGENELTKFRYDVVLHFASENDKKVENADSTEVQMFKTDETPASAISQAISQLWAEQPAALKITHVPNHRVAGEVAQWRSLQEADGDSMAVELKASSKTFAGVHPDEWRQAPAQSPVAKDYSVTLSWSPEDAIDCYDVCFRQKNESLPPLGSRPEVPHNDWVKQHAALANRPMEEKLAARLTPQLRAGLAKEVPQYMLPSAFVLMDELPKTIRGKIDREALPEPPSGRPAWATGYIAPQTDEQRLVAQIWEELLGFTPIGVADNFFDLGGYSMLAVRVMAEIESRSGVSIPLATLFEEPTVERLAAVLQDPSLAESPSLVPLQTGGEAAPLYCIHPAGGAVFCYRSLAATFAEERPVIGVQAVGVDGRQPPHESMEEVVAHYAQLIQKHTPEGLIHLCGWSLGGNIAYALATHLSAVGREVGLVGLFDAAAVPPEEDISEGDLAPLLAALFPDMEHLPLEEIRSLDTEEQVAYFTERAKEAGLVDGEELASNVHIFNVFQKNVQVVHQYQPKPYAGEVTLFRAAEQATTNALMDDRALGWEAYVKKVTVVDTPSDHAQMMHPPQVDALAEQLKQALRKSLG